MDKKTLDRNWYYFLTLDRDLYDTTLYIEPEGQESTYSFAFYKLIMLGGSEAESLMKQLCKEIDPGNTGGNIGQFKDTILGKYPQIENVRINVSRWGGKEIMPFDNWSTKKLQWWDDYSELKHSRFKTIEKATFENTAYTLGALFVLNYYLYAAAGEHLPIGSKSFDSCYTPPYLLCSADEKLPDFSHKTATNNCS